MRRMQYSEACARQFELADQFAACIAQGYLTFATCRDNLAAEARVSGATESWSDLVDLFDEDLSASVAEWTRRRTMASISVRREVCALIADDASKSEVLSAANACNGDLDFPLTDPEVKDICREEWRRFNG